MSYNYLLACWGDGPGNLAPVLTAARRLRRRGHEVRVLGLGLAAVAATSLLAMTLAAWMPLPLVISLLVASSLAFGLIAPNAMQGAMQPLPQIAGAAGAATGCIQMATGAVASGLVAALHDGRSALSMTALMALCSILALVSYVLLARPAERSVHDSRRATPGLPQLKALTMPKR